MDKFGDDLDLTFQIREKQKQIQEHNDRLYMKNLKRNFRRKKRYFKN